MKKSFKKIMSTMIVATLLTCMCAATVFAKGNDETYLEVDTVGNSYMAGYNMTLKSDVKNDLVGAGYNVSANSSSIGQNVALAGYNVSLYDSTVGCDAFMAGYNVTVDSEIDNNLFICGYSLNINSKTKANAINAAGSVINIMGESSYVSASAGEIYYNATTDGDVILNAGKVVIGPDANVTGKLTIKSSNDPVLPDTSFASEYVFEKQSEDSDASADGSIEDEIISEISSEITKSSSPSIMSQIGQRCLKKVYWTLAYVLIALFFCLFTNEALNESKNMIKERKVPVIVSGLLMLIGFPLALLVVALTYVGIPMSGILLLTIMVLIFVSVPFASASIGRLVFDKISPNFNKMVASLISVAVISLVKIVPFISGLINIACVVYLFGYIVQKCYLNMKCLKCSETIAVREEENAE